MDLDFLARHPVLARPPLKSVICQMRFPHLVGMAESDVRPIQKLIVDSYPASEVARAAGLTLGPGGISTTDSEPVFHFRSVDKNWTVTLTPSSLSLETTDYLNFRNFVERWYEVALRVTSELEIERQDRLGLRYVDEFDCPIDGTESKIDQVFRPELVGVVGAHERTKKLFRSMHEMRFIQPVGKCTLRYGLIEADNDNAQAVLDLDFYDEEPKEFDLDNQVRSLGDFNEGAYDLFRWAVTDELFDSFNDEE